MPDSLNLDVLVVDDSATIREYLLAFLKERGCRVETAENGKAAQDVLRRFQAELIILDFHMPEMDGFTMLRTLQSEPDWSAIPIFVLTGKALDDGTSGMIRMEPNVRAVLTKPTDERTLAKLLREFSKSKGKFIEIQVADSEPAAAESNDGQFGANIQSFSLKDLEKPPKAPGKPEEKKP